MTFAFPLLFLAEVLYPAPSERRETFAALVRPSLAAANKQTLRAARGLRPLAGRAAPFHPLVHGAPPVRPVFPVCPSAVPIQACACTQLPAMHVMHVVRNVQPSQKAAAPKRIPALFEFVCVRVCTRVHVNMCVHLRASVCVSVIAHVQDWVCVWVEGWVYVRARARAGVCVCAWGAVRVSNCGCVFVWGPSELAASSCVLCIQLLSVNPSQLCWFVSGLTIVRFCARPFLSQAGRFPTVMVQASVSVVIGRDRKSVV